MQHAGSVSCELEDPAGRSLQWVQLLLIPGLLGAEVTVVMQPSAQTSGCS